MVSTLDTGVLQGNWSEAMTILGTSENYLGSTWEAIAEADEEENADVVEDIDHAAEIVDEEAELRA